ncbi:c-type cytochrome [Spiribacter vilamensis]|uniref:Cytochrome c553 n=1 Tax=Spiribacter vilamensis TaxID=531306 RepID=A0A4V2GJ50_9GAMM|nr:cytochrome c [Spiribacter vilamensis]RZU98985.1 cytochrome c553 [Spiribacter vilamensis]TVO62009.1 cytochrome c [Spiribacter vilamensis]
MKRLTVFLGAMALLAAGSVPAQSIGDVQAGQAKSQTCAACHGAKGASDNSAFPMLAGQHADYLVHALKAYKSGDRQNAIMNGQAAALSDKDIRDLAAYFAAQSEAIQTLERRSAKSDG